jgi:hypothetical protein
VKSRPNLYWCGDGEPPSTFNIAGQPRSDPKEAPDRRVVRPVQTVRNLSRISSLIMRGTLSCNFVILLPG